MVVVAGETMIDPLMPCAVSSIPLMETDVAPVVVQLNVEDCPAVIGDGLAENEVTTGGGVGFTTIVVVAVAVPPDDPEAVSV